VIRSFLAAVLTAGLLACGGGPASDVFDSAPTTSATVLDAVTGLEWQRVAEQAIRIPWPEVEPYCAALVLDGSSGFRVPTLDELRTLVRNCPATVTGGPCGLGDDCNTDACWTENGLACRSCGVTETCYWPDWIEGMCGDYWTRTRFIEPNNDDANRFFVSFTGAGFLFHPEQSGNRSRIRCVR
jgi:hypothetical protein